MRKITLKGLRKKLDKVFSKYTVKRDHNICVTCGKPGNQAGHFISRRHLGTRWFENNAHCQCVRCNIFLHGNMISYYEFMERTYGKEIIEYLKKQSKNKINKDDMMDFINCYENALKELK